jgi:DNA-binding transcriptional ArsR family regulator
MTTVYERVDALVPAQRNKIQVVQGDRRPLPASIAIASDHALLLKGLPLGPRNVLAELARYLKKANPLGTVFPSKETIASRIGITARSVYRHLNVLEEAGLIVREPQQHRKGTGVGEFLTGHIKLTRNGAACLGLVASDHATLASGSTGANPMNARTPDGAFHSLTNKTTGHAANTAPAVVIHNVPSDKMSVHNKSLTEPKLSALKRSAPKAMATVPAELTWLLRAGVKAGEIFFLMGLASTHQKRLSDISDAKRDTLLARGLKGRGLKAYLMALAKSDVCFKTLAANARQTAHNAEQQAMHEQAATVFKARFAGVALADKGLTTLHLIDEQCAFAQTWDGVQWSAMPMHNLRPWMAGLQSGKLILATQEMEDRLRRRVVSQPIAASLRSPISIKPVATSGKVQSEPRQGSREVSLGAIKSIRALWSNTREKGIGMRNLAST